MGDVVVPGYLLPSGLALSVSGCREAAAVAYLSLSLALAHKRPGACGDALVYVTAALHHVSPVAVADLQTEAWNMGSSD